jgi:hypothetical protein
MARRRMDVDWYVDMSERMERRDARRKWIVLAVCVSISLLLILGGSAFLWIRANRPDWFDSTFGWLFASSPAAPATGEKKRTPSQVLTPIIVESLEEGDLKYPQLDANGFPTSITHYFREFPLEYPPTKAGEEKQRGFRINRSDPSTGTVETYRLRNVGTGDQHYFREVPVKRVVGDEWAITDDGHGQIRRELQAKMKVPLSRVLRE